jgi:polyphosphate kinase 2 (PPK2 family)
VAFCTVSQYEGLLQDVVPFEHMLVGAGIQIPKYYLDISKKKQKRRLRDRGRDPLKQLKTSPGDAVAPTH